MSEVCVDATAVDERITLLANKIYKEILRGRLPILMEKGVLVKEEIITTAALVKVREILAERLLTLLEKTANGEAFVFTYVKEERMKH